MLVILTVAVGGCGGSDTPSLAGDPGRGKKLFVTQGCGNCHTFAAAKSIRNAGPNLDAVVKKYDDAFIRKSIVDPGAYIEKGSGGSLGGDKPYRVPMPASGPDADLGDRQIGDQQIADLVAFLAAAREE